MAGLRRWRARRGPGGPAQRELSVAILDAAFRQPLFLYSRLKKSESGRQARWCWLGAVVKLAHGRLRCDSWHIGGCAIAVDVFVFYVLCVGLLCFYISPSFQLFFVQAAITAIQLELLSEGAKAKRKAGL